MYIYIYTCLCTAMCEILDVQMRVRMLVYAGISVRKNETILDNSCAPSNLSKSELNRDAKYI
jgi:hypothetical protein